MKAYQNPILDMILFSEDEITTGLITSSTPTPDISINDEEII